MGIFNRNFTSRIFTVWIFVQLSLPVFTQIDFKHFPIDSFKLPSIHRTWLELEGTIVGTYDYAYELEREGKNNSSYFSPQASLQYSGFINRPDIQSSYNLSTNPVFSVHRKQLHPQHGSIGDPDRYLPHPEEGIMP